MVKMNVFISNVVNSKRFNKSDKIRKLYKMNVNVNDISKLLECRYSFVYSVVKRKYKEVRKKESKSDKIRSLYESGSKVNEISKLLNVSYGFVFNVIKRYELSK